MIKKNYVLNLIFYMRTVLFGPHGFEKKLDKEKNWIKIDL
jgi:hypothetical protein